ncbi:hypothetical protein TSAR_006847 [Trichomalopsis sarcophagae]|uniref:Uncharacterized protein n=1 Tax=Trichomalopsis sarcophagae TaxID=543379 RepID=A0A232EFR0_9HYME|nr:hypothetical protein TSAR_006847 [Trichomalopsis sarcophagae]
MDQDELDLFRQAITVKKGSKRAIEQPETLAPRDNEYINEYTLGLTLIGNLTWRKNPFGVRGKQNQAVCEIYYSREVVRPWMDFDNAPEKPLSCWIAIIHYENELPDRELIPTESEAFRSFAYHELGWRQGLKVIYIRNHGAEWP